MLLSAVAFGQKPSIRDYVETMMEEPDVASATFAINIFNASTGQNIYSYNANRSLVPASVVKMITTAVGFEELGKNFRFKTSIGYSGTIDKRNVNRIS